MDEKFSPVQCCKGFFSKVGKKGKGPYRILRKFGPVNYQVVREDIRRDVRIVHVRNPKPCYPIAEELALKEQENI